MGSKLALVLLLVLCSFIKDIHTVPIDSDQSVSTTETTTTAVTTTTTTDPISSTIQTLTLNSNETNSNQTGNNAASKSLRRGRFMNFDFPLLPMEPSKSSNSPRAKFKAIQSRILAGHQTPLEDLSSNSFQDNKFMTYTGLNNRDTIGQTSHHITFVDNPVTNKYDAMLIGQPAVKTQPPVDRFSTLSYANPSVHYSGSSGIEPSDLLPYYNDHYTKTVYPHNHNPAIYHLVPVKSTQPQVYKEPTLSEHVKDTIFMVKDHVSGTMQKMKNVLGFHGFSEKVASPDALLAVAPVAAGLLAGGLAVAYFASKQGGSINGTTSPFNIFGKRSVRDIISEEDLNHIVARLDPVQREYLQKLQFYGPQRWKDVTCAKYIFCDVMSKATPIHILDMQRKIGIFLSRYVF